MDVVRRVLRFAWAALLLEITLYRALGRWVVRRPDVPAGTVPIGYSRLVAPMLWLWIFGSAVEVVVLDVLLSRWWTPLRIPLSSSTSHRSPTAATTSGSMVALAGAPSSCRPPTDGSTTSSCTPSGRRCWGWSAT